jgi:hypothetical protein
LWGSPGGRRILCRIDYSIFFNLMADGRKNNGGTRRNAGRKTDKNLTELQRVLDEACPYEARVEAMRVLVSKAQASDVGAAKLLFGYLYGTPIQRMQDENGGAIIRVVRVDDRPATETLAPGTAKDTG